LLQWTKAVNLGFLEESNSVVVDHAGDVYISGYAGGNPDGSSYNGRDVFLSKVNSVGELLWTRQFGSPSVDDAAIGMTVDGTGNIYLTGYTDGGLGETGLGARDAFLAKYNGDGALLWKQLLGSDMPDESYAVAADSIGNVYVTSQTSIPIGGIQRRPQPSVSKFDSEGNLLWQQQQLDVSRFGSSYLTPQSIVVDELDNVFLSGYRPDQGNIFVSRLDTQGNVHWTESFALNSISSVAADGLGNVYFSATDIDGRGQTLFAATIMKLDGNGETLWTTMTDALASDFSRAVATDGLGAVYLAGTSYDGNYGTNPGIAHAFIAKFSEVPEPASLVLLFVCGAIFLKRKRATQTVERLDCSAR
jgi:hypothetical protein